MTAELLSTHAEYEAAHEGEAIYQRALEHHRQIEWRVRHNGTLDGYTPRREFPCRGALWLQDPTGSPIREIHCDTCSFETTVRQRKPADMEEW